MGHAARTGPPAAFLAVTAGALAVLAGCTSSTRHPSTPAARGTTSASTTTVAPATTATTTPTTAAGTTLQPGTYADRHPGTPHYVLAITVGPAGAVSMTVTFVYQDGRTQQVMALSGTAHGNGAVLTGPGGTPRVDLTASAGTVVLTGCTAYLQNAADAQDCTFSLSAAG
jgi:hypothetical protein